MSNPFLLFGGSSNRPPAKAHNALPPFDPNDSGGIVHTVLPPEQVIPAHFADPTFMRADFNGVCIDMNRWGTPPMLKGANSTPINMLMTPMAVLYPRKFQDAILTEHAERGYDDFIIECDGDEWNLAANGFDANPSSILQWAQYVRSWGFRVVLWRGNPTRGLDSMFETLIQAGVVQFYIHGEEVDRKVTAEQYEASIQQIDGYLGGKIPMAAHFTCDGDRHMAYPIGFPRDTFLLDWSKYDGRLHLMVQNDVTAPAGLQGASMYYARLRVMGQGDGAQGPGAPNSKVIAFETMASAQLMGQCTEEYGCLRDWELLCGTRLDPRIPPTGGFGNGCRYPDGTPI